MSVVDGAAQMRQEQQLGGESTHPHILAEARKCSMHRGTCLCADQKAAPEFDDPPSLRPSQSNAHSQ